MLVVYSDYVQYTDPETGKTVYVPGIKIGDGSAYLSDLSFLGDGSPDQGWEILIEHVNNWDIHVSATDRHRWDQKLNLIYPEDQPQMVDFDMLEFTRE